MDDYVQMAETTALESLKRFCVAVVDSLGDEYLRGQSTQDLSLLLRIGEERGFLECLALWIACTGAGRSPKRLGGEAHHKREGADGRARSCRRL